MGKNLGGLWFGNEFSDTTPKVQSINEKTEKLDFIKIKNFYSVKDSMKRMRRQATAWGKVFAKDTSDKGLLYKIYKELLKFNNKKTNHLLKKWAKDLNRHFMKYGIQMTNKYVKRCFTPYVIREMQIKQQ